MTARGGGPTPTELRNTGPRGVPTYPLGIAERWHRNLQSLAKERNPAEIKRQSDRTLGATDRAGMVDLALAGIKAELRVGGRAADARRRSGAPKLKTYCDWHVVHVYCCVIT